MIEYQNQIRKNLQKISFQKKLKFGIQICERLLPEYVKFYELNNFGDPELLRKGIDICQKNKESKFSEREINDLIRQIESITPDTDDFGELIGSLALNAAGVVSETLKFVLNSNDEHIFDVASFMYDTIDFQVGDKYPTLNDKEIESHPLIVKEIEWQLQQTSN